MATDREQYVADLERQLVARTRELAEAREQQAATAEVLKAISRSALDLESVLQTLTDNACRLCGPAKGIIYRRVGDEARLAATCDITPATRELMRTNPPRPGRGHVTARAMLERRTVHIPDAWSDPEYTLIPVLKREGVRSLLSVPLLREDSMLGVLTILKSAYMPFTQREIELVETFADQAVIAIENARLLQELQERNQQLTESLTQQTAIGDVLKAIAASPTDQSSALQVIADRAVRVCDGASSSIGVVEDEVSIIRAESSVLAPETSAPSVGQRRPKGSAWLGGYVLLTGRAVHIKDVQSDEMAPFPASRAMYAGGPTRTTVLTPMLRQGQAIGVIQVSRYEVKPFTERELRLLETFADQAAIAIENARLFQALQERNHELSEALERQAATVEVLQIISQAPTDLPRVLQTVVEHAARLCQTVSGLVATVEGHQIRVLAADGMLTPTLDVVVPLGRGSIGGRAVLDRQVIHVPDLAAVPAAEYPEERELQRRFGENTATLGVPLLRDGEAIGLLLLVHAEARPFTAAQIALVQMFADQAVIAIENARLFQELQERNRQLHDALEQQTSTTEVLRIIASSPADLQPVLHTLTTNAARLLQTDYVIVWLGDTEHVQLAARHGALPQMSPVGRQRSVTHDWHVGRAMLERQVIHVRDVEAVGDAEWGVTKLLANRLGGRTFLAAPLLQGGRAIGAIAARRLEMQPFTEQQMALLESFADQAVIAVENVRLFAELQARTRDLEQVSLQKSAFLANMSHELRTPLNGIIGFSEVLLDPAMPVPNDMRTQFLDNIYQSGKHLLALINDILDLSKVESGKMELHPEDFDLREALAGVHSVVRALSDRKQQTLTFETMPNQQVILRHDPGRFKQVLFNLLSNAVKFTPDGGSVTTTARLDGAWAEIVVTDTGIGIAPDDQGKVFEEFQQIDTGYGRKQQGTGLGLALVRTFVRLMDGDVTLVSAMGEGSTFTVRIPLG